MEKIDQKTFVFLDNSEPVGVCGVGESEEGLFPHTNGFRSYKKILDALMNASGPIIYLAEPGHVISADGTRILSQSIRYVSGFNASSVLIDFAMGEALNKLGYVRNFCSERDYNLAEKWLISNNNRLKFDARWNMVSISAFAAEMHALSSSEVCKDGGEGIKAWLAAKAVWSAGKSAPEEAAKSVVDLSLRFRTTSEGRSVARDLLNLDLTNEVRDKTGWQI